jgi:hypothetical protein
MSELAGLLHDLPNFIVSASKLGHVLYPITSGVW